jgi:hypothetical protein
LLPEAELVSRDGLLIGRADLIARGPVDMVLDYKSGAILDSGSGELKPRYARQLLLYAYLESESTGRWPSRLAVVPIAGPIADVQPDRIASEALADEARSLLRDYNETAPQPQPANASEDSCSWCEWAVDCAAFWKLDTRHWARGRWAIRGVANHVMISNGMVTLAIQDREETVTIRGIDLSSHQELARMDNGAYVELTGLLRDGDRESFRIGPMGRIRIIES